MGTILNKNNKKHYKKSPDTRQTDSDWVYSVVKLHRKQQKRKIKKDADKILRDIISSLKSLSFISFFADFLRSIFLFLAYFFGDICLR